MLLKGHHGQTVATVMAIFTTLKRGRMISSFHVWAVMGLMTMIFRVVLHNRYHSLTMIIVMVVIRCHKLAMISFMTVMTSTTNFILHRMCHGHDHLECH